MSSTSAITCDTQREARDQLRRATSDLDRGVALDAEVPTVAAYLARWLETAVKPPKREPKTYENYAYAVSLITPTLGKLPIDRVRPDQIDALLHDLQTLWRAARAGALRQHGADGAGDPPPRPRAGLQAGDRGPQRGGPERAGGG